VIRDSIFILFSFFACNTALKSSDLCFDSDNRFYIIYILYNDLLPAADDGDVTALCLLDLTASFDTVDLLMLRLERQFGLRGVVLQWFCSYLTDRTFQVVYAGRKSAVVIIPLCPKVRS